MAYCKKCGNQLDDGAKFCPKCGNPVVSTQYKRDSSENSFNYSIELVSYKYGKRDQIASALTDLLRIDSMDAINTIDSAPCSLATGLSLIRVVEFAQRLENVGAVIVVKKDGEPIHETEKSQSDKKEEELGCLSLILSFLIPIFGFFVFAMNWRDEPKKADSALQCGLLGLVVSIIFSVISLITYWEGYCRLAQIITGKF